VSNHLEDMEISARLSAAHLLLQVHPIGLLLAVVTAHFYFTATTVGELSARRVANIMSGASASMALICSASEPMAEWWEAHQSESISTTEIQELYTPKTENQFTELIVNPTTWIVIGLGLLVILIFKDNK
jgi:hypothetical protein